MRNVWCKIWNWFLNTFTDALDAIGYGLKTVGTVVVEVLGAVADAVGGAVGSIFGGSNFIVWLGAGVLAYFVLTKQDDKDKAPSMVGTYGKGGSDAYTV